MRRVVVQICAALAWIAFLVPAAFSQIIDFRALDITSTRTDLSNIMQPAGNKSFTVLGSTPARTLSGSMDSMYLWPQSGIKASYRLPVSLLQSRGGDLFANASHPADRSSFAIDPHTFCVTVSDTRYAPLYTPEADTDCLVAEGLATTGQGESSPFTEPVIMFLGGIGLICLSGRKKSLPSAVSMKRMPLAVHQGDSREASLQFRQRFESEAA